MSNREYAPSDACGCCAGAAAQAPATIYNRPALSAIAYRIGTHAEILASLLARLSTKEYPALSKLRTRDKDDFSIALLDAFACMADVLTFYQERIANEAYLGTAVERRSLDELARLIGYRLKPGVAAETWLAFTLEEPVQLPASDAPVTASGVPEKLTLPVGVQVRSVPGPDEKPQTFETAAAIEARPQWNTLKPRLKELKQPVSGTKVVYLQGTDTRLKSGDTLLFVGTEREQDPGSELWGFSRIQSVTTDSKAGHTIVALEQGLSSSPQNPKIYALRLRASLFGHNAPDWRVMSEEIKRGYLGLKPGDPIAHSQWPGFTIADISDPPTSNATGTGLYGEYFDRKDLAARKFTRTDNVVNFDWGAGSPDSRIGANSFSVRWKGWVQAVSSGTYSFFTWSDDGVRLWVDNLLIIDNWTDHAAREDSGSLQLSAGRKYDIKLEFYENTGAATIKLSWTPPGQTKQIIPQSRLYPRSIHSLHLDAVYPKIVPGGWLVLATPEHRELYQVTSAGEDARSSFTLTGKTTRLVLSGENLRERFNERLRETAVFAESERLKLAETPDTRAVSGATLTLDRKVEGLVKGRTLILTGETTAGKIQSEALTLLRSEADGTATRLVFTKQLGPGYKRNTVKVHANVAPATHGETVHQILGSGAAHKAHQQLSLKHAPLTHVKADNETGAAAALKVLVDDIRWEEVSTLYRAGANDRSYLLHQDEDGKARIQFGDGRRGTRLPTGSENVRAVYRKGLGDDGNLKTGQLSQLMTRLLGLKGVSNPLPAKGGVDADDAANARRNIPLGALTLGRAVSLRDYEDFARGYTGIAKAKAQVLNLRAGRTVLLSLAGDKGIKPDAKTLKKLLEALKKGGDPFVRCRALPYVDTYFRLGLRILRHPDHESKIVLAAVDKALRAAFSFSACAFDQPITRSEVIATAQGVKGVQAVDLNYLYSGTSATLEERLVPAAAGVDSEGGPTAAELLLLDPGALDHLEEMS